jgi:hypothetical protein
MASTAARADTAPLPVVWRTLAATLLA